MPTLNLPMNISVSLYPTSVMAQSGVDPGGAERAFPPPPPRQKKKEREKEHKGKGKDRKKRKEKRKGERRRSGGGGRKGPCLPAPQSKKEEE